MVDEEDHHELRDVDHILQHRHHVLLQGHCLDLALIEDPHEETEEWLALEQVVSVLKMVHLLCLLRSCEHLSCLTVEHYRGARLLLLH